MSSTLYTNDLLSNHLRKCILSRNGVDPHAQDAIITGNVSKRVVVRAIGPSLPVDGNLADPTLELHLSDGNVIANDDWKINQATGESQESAIRATQLAPTNDRESAILALLSPGAYMAIVRGKNGTSGVGLAEIYDTTSSDSSVLANISTRGYVGTDANVMLPSWLRTTAV